jgi:hypothetical protein
MVPAVTAHRDERTVPGRYIRVDETRTIGMDAPFA